jgi:hypothetical protein
MDDLRLLNMIRRDWWLPALVACVGWVVECWIDGLSIFQTLLGPLLICMWGAAILLLDRWVFKGINREND